MTTLLPFALLPMYAASVVGWAVCLPMVAAQKAIGL